MKRFLTLVGMLSAAMAFAFVPAISATAATGSAVTTGINGRTVAISMTPGTHTVAETIPIQSQPGFTAARFGPLANPEISVRVGKNNCGGFKGNYSIYISDYLTDPNGDSVPIWALSVSGTEWDNCDYYTPNTTVYTYVKYTALVTNNEALSPSAPGDSVGANFAVGTSVVIPGNVYVTACLKWNNGWGCGPTAGPFN